MLEDAEVRTMFEVGSAYLAERNSGGVVVNCYRYCRSSTVP
jgi:hypothetical protein